ncbi:hypothetical protein S7S_14575 [Isoalcanivorax pacificus W11-5]|uniref:Uncharacterized protein n=1 Tax=Isoalcanivorax pacificus W11-5 TaxID=391936 RepID=A0A0B4XSP3_9GAMM|nr:hypothetical protein S7S_14575 [Isoalcanivorax pacificus W11-5]
MRASSSPIRPALRSASIAICLPGMASSMKRAPTSAMRPAPLVITMKLITTRIRNTARPTAKLPPTRKCPNASITLPAASPPWWPSISTTRVEATFSDRRSRVVNSNTVGNDANSSVSRVNIATSSTITASAMLKVKNRSSASGGNGRIIMLRTSRMSTGPASSFARPSANHWPAVATPSPFMRRLPADRVPPAPAAALAAPAVHHAAAAWPRPALPPRRCTARREFPAPDPRAGTGRAPAAAPPATAHRARCPAPGYGRQWRPHLWRPRAARPCAVLRNAAPRHSGSGW